MQDIKFTEVQNQFTEAQAQSLLNEGMFDDTQSAPSDFLMNKDGVLEGPFSPGGMLAREEIVEARRKYFLQPEVQAEILMTNYLQSNPDMILTGQQKRNLRREFLKKAKKGVYRKLFMQRAEDVPSVKTKESFEKLNG